MYILYVHKYAVLYDNQWEAISFGINISLRVSWLEYCQREFTYIPDSYMSALIYQKMIVWTRKENITI